MNNDLIDRLAFAIQDEGMSRLRAWQCARAALAVLEPGDRIGPDLMVAPHRPDNGADPSNRAARL